MSQSLDTATARWHRRKLRQARASGMLTGVLSQLEPGDLAVDCGANVGAITTKLAATGADVVAFEPDPVAFEALSKATKKLPNVTCHQAAVGIDDGIAQLFRDDSFDSNPLGATRRSTVVSGAKRMNQKQYIEVAVLNLIDQLRSWQVEYGEVAFLKLDIEGAELDILTDMLRFDLFEGVKLTVAEMHGYKFPALKDEFQALRKTISEKYPPRRVFLDWI